MELTRIFFDYANETYMTENNENLPFDFVLTIQRQELMKLVEEGLLTWQQAFEMEGDFVAWNEIVDAFQGYAE